MRMRLFLAALVVTLAVPAVAADFGVRAGQYRETDEPFVGIEVAVPFSQLIVFNPNIEYVFFEEATLGTVNADVQFQFTRGSFVPWLGAGAALIYTRPDDGDATTRAGLNLLGGVGFRLGSVLPYAQVKYVRASGDRNEVVIGGGVRF